MRPQVGNVIHNKYRLLRLIGDGGMGSVFEARHEVLGTTVALKFLHPELSRRPGLVQRFLQEARVSAQIQSPNVVRVTDVDQTPSGLAFIVMELLDGKTLQAQYEELYRVGQRLSYADALEYAIQMLEGVSAAHRTGIVHRDLKPDNVMITRSSRGDAVIKLLDFGIAKLKVSGQFDRGLTRPGVIMGTPEYMAPEQAYSADAVDSRADIFSLGVIIFEMLAGRRPVGGDEPQQIASAYLSGQVADLFELFPECPAGLVDAVHRAMAPLAKDRYASVDALRSAIEPFWLSIRPPPSLHASHPSLSFGRLTPESGGSARPRAIDVSSRPPPVAERPAPMPIPVPAAAPPVVCAAIVAPSPVPKTLPPEDPEEEAPAAVAAAPAAVHDATANGPQSPPRAAHVEPVNAGGSPSVDGAATAEGGPPLDSDVPSRQPTPLGGLSPYRDGVERPLAASAPSQPAAEARLPSDRPAPAPVLVEAPVAVSVALPKPPPSNAGKGTFKMPAAGDVAIPATSIATGRAAPNPGPPQGVMHNEGAAPAAAPPVQPPSRPAIAGTRAASLLGSAAHGGVAGTAFDGPGLNGAGTAEAAPLFAPATGAPKSRPDYEGASGPKPRSPDAARAAASPSIGVADGGGRGTAVGPGTAPGAGPGTAIDARPYVAPPPAPAPVPAAPPPRARAGKARRGAPLALVLLLASGVSAAVVGGVYFAHRGATTDDRADDLVPAPAPTSVPPDPQAAQPDPGPVSPTPAQPPKNVIHPPPSTGPHPGHAPSFPQFPGTARPHAPPPPPSGKPTAPDQPPPPPSLPPSLPIMIPSGLPFPFPPAGPPPGPGPQPPPAAPSGNRGRGGMPPLEPIPRPPQGVPEAYLPLAPGDR